MKFLFWDGPDNDPIEPSDDSEGDPVDEDYDCDPDNIPDGAW